MLDVTFLHAEKEKRSGWSGPFLPPGGWAVPVQRAGVGEGHCCTPERWDDSAPLLPDLGPLELIFLHRMVCSCPREAPSVDAPCPPPQPQT